MNDDNGQTDNDLQDVEELHDPRGERRLGPGVGHLFSLPPHFDKLFFKISLLSFHILSLFRGIR
jgi:hypothetical protein